ncbi:hypothetical protein [Chthonobacter rhizosphaerae]|uniref:hypothetical protein n=1 Tax=Chthonobacter rhizosphaerae TaxID=2735553 RepID=UPI0015EF7DD8|nr:hypothetical protein [Chthonobacter rhizosphaerae]
MTADPVRIALSRDEALVLHEWLARVVDEENADGIADTVETDADVWALEALRIVLEQALPEAFAETSEKALKAASKRIVTANGPWAWSDAGG